jgi:uncharacterized membrane protein YqiK
VVFRVRCFMCGAHDVRLILGGREIIHARCQACNTNLLAEVHAIEAEAMEELEAARAMADGGDRNTRSLPAISRVENAT